MNVAKVAEIIAWGYQSGGLLDETGFTVPLKNQGHLHTAFAPPFQIFHPAL